MKCPRCGTDILNGSTFCVKCGANLKEILNMNNNINNAPINEQVSNSTFVETPNTTNISNVSLNYLMYIIAILLKPIKCFKEEESKLNNSKTSVILALVVSILMTIANLIGTILATVRVSSYSYLKGYTYSWEWDNLKEIKWLELIGKNFLISVGIILAITLVFYFASLVIKKNLSFIKSLSISATSLIPIILGAMILSPILNIIWNPLGVIATVAGLVYSLIILYELMNSEFNLESDKKIYFNLICFGILITAGYYLYTKLFMSSITDGLNSILDMFK